MDGNRYANGKRPTGRLCSRNRILVFLPQMETAAIQTNGLTRRFGALTAVEDVTLSVAPGQFFGFLGPNGAGKSTTIKMLTGLLSASSGSIQILGLDLAQN